MFAANPARRRSVNALGMCGLLAALAAFAWGCKDQAAGPSAPVEKTSAAKTGQTAATREYAIEGMTCEGCVESVTAALKDTPGVESAEVSLKDKKATVVGSAAPEAVEQAVDKAGYKARPLARP